MYFVICILYFAFDIFCCVINNVRFSSLFILFGLFVNCTNELFLILFRNPSKRCLSPLRPINKRLLLPDDQSLIETDAEEEVDSEDNEDEEEQKEAKKEDEEEQEDVIPGKI